MKHETRTVEPLFLTLADTCMTLRVSRSALYRVIARGDLRCVHLGRSVRIPAADVRAFADRIVRRSGGDGPRAQRRSRL